MEALQFENLKEAKEYYDERYKTGYMDEWDKFKLHIIEEIVGSINLPPGSLVLDLGCGSGVFTRLLERLLPHCRVVGCDLSATAIELARARSDRSTYFVMSPDGAVDVVDRYDLIFTHHVLEHVFDLAQFAQLVAGLAKPSCILLHVLPCANDGSFEKGIAVLSDGGIDPNAGNRFHFEDPSHLRRMTTEDVVNLFSRFGFTLEKGYYTNQYFGAWRWITGSNPDYIGELFDPQRAKPSDRGLFRRYRALAVALSYLRLPLRIRIMEKLRRGGRQAVIGVAAIALWLPSWVVNALVEGLARREWSLHKHDPNG